MLFTLLACASTTALPVGRFSAQGGLTADGTGFVLAGGASGTAGADVLDDAWTLDAASGAWSPGVGLPLPVVRSVAVRHPTQSGAWLFMGGSTTGYAETDRVWLWSPEAGHLGDLAEGPSPRYKHMAVARQDGTVVLLGGKTDDDEPIIHADLWVYDVADNTWTELTPTGQPPGGLYRHAMADDPWRGRVWVFGGYDAAESRHARLWSLDPATGAFTEVPQAGTWPDVRASHTLVATEAGLHAWGGHATDVSVWFFDPSASTWTELPPATADFPLARDAHVSDVSADGSQLWVVAGDPVDDSAGDFVFGGWWCDLATGAWYLPGR